ncbi:TIR domain-containing protein [Altererythrobacter sp. MF3-039]|uniref:TIR domain-containing protein n=1 Tax=Altererythrobacter sp. MF3-039 TaxID=3252901 RepID=UPI00390C8074
MRSHDIFVSYSREDRGAAMRIAALLENEGFSVWWDAAIHSGESFDEVIEEQLRSAKAAVVLWSPRSVNSRWVRAEATLADRRQIFVPVIIEKCELPIIFELTHNTDLSHWDGNTGSEEWQRLISDIRLLTGGTEDQAAHKAKPSRGFLLGDEPSAEKSPARRSPRPPVSPATAAADAPQAASEHEQTAFYTPSDNALHPDGQVHCLEMGPEEAPLVRHPITALGAKLGRSSPADIIFSDKRISRRHCEVEVRNGEMLVTDLNSTNGTFVDGQRIDNQTALPPGSELMLGDVVLTHRVRSFAEIG